MHEREAKKGRERAFKRWIMGGLEATLDRSINTWSKPDRF
jgi:hypothetical protein